MLVPGLAGLLQAGRILQAALVEGACREGRDLGVHAVLWHKPAVRALRVGFCCRSRSVHQQRQTEPVTQTTLVQTRLLHDILRPILLLRGRQDRGARQARHIAFPGMRLRAYWSSGARANLTCVSSTLTGKSALWRRLKRDTLYPASAAREEMTVAGSCTGSPTK